jgi:hypothetical protein
VQPLLQWTQFAWAFLAPWHYKFTLKCMCSSWSSVVSLVAVVTGWIMDTHQLTYVLFRFP